MGALAAMLALTGIFGMASYAVSRRLRELGIRMALGAARRQVLRAAIGRPVILLSIGSLLGLGFGALASKVLGVVVYQATSRDPLVLVGVVLSMALIGALAAWLPARRALAVQPSRLLREE
jgi:ABC-type antimicrobial peptide transport system permease subunit